MSEATCAECLFFQLVEPPSRPVAAERKVGYCRRRAPLPGLVITAEAKAAGQIISTSRAIPTSAVWPVVLATDWCGEIRQLGRAPIIEEADA